MRLTNSEKHIGDACMSGHCFDKFFADGLRLEKRNGKLCINAFNDNFDKVKSRSYTVILQLQSVGCQDLAGAMRNLKGPLTKSAHWRSVNIFPSLSMNSTGHWPCNFLVPLQKSSSDVRDTKVQKAL